MPATMPDPDQPLTDKDLARLEYDARLHEHSSVWQIDHGHVLRLISEVRRLRKLARQAAPLVVGADAWCHGCERTLTTQSHAEGCPIGALEREAGE